MFRFDATILLLITLLRRLLVRLCGTWGVASGSLSRAVVPAHAVARSFDARQQNGGLNRQGQADIEWITTRLDPIPLGCDASINAQEQGGSMPASRPAPPGWA
jgi:hypothetical protein